MSCEIVYDKNGVISHVTENGQRSLEFDIIKESLGDKSIEIYNIYRENPNKSDRINKSTINPNRVEVEERPIDSASEYLSTEVGFVKDSSKRNSGRKQNSIEESIEHSLTKGKSYYVVSSNLDYSIDPQTVSVTASVDNYPIATATIKQELGKPDVLENILVLENVKGQGLALKVLDITIKNKVKKGEDLIISEEVSKEFKEELDNYLLKGILKKEGNTYIIKNDVNIGQAIEISSINNKPLPFEDRKILRNFFLSLGITTTQELKDKFKEIVIDGILSFDINNLKKIFNVYESRQINKDKELQEEIQRISSSINSTEYEIPEYDSKYVRVESTEIVSGKQKVTNPFVEKNKVIRQVAGNPDFLNVIDPIYVELYYSDPEFKAELDYASNNLGVVKVNKINELGDLIEYKGDTEYYLTNVAGPQIFENKEDINRLYNISKAEALTVLEDIYTNGIVSKEDYSLRIIDEATQNQAMEILDRVLYGDVTEASRQFEELFKIETETRVITTNNHNSDVILETEMNPVDVLSKYDLLSLGENRYRKVNQNETIYDILPEVINNKYYNPEDLNNEEFIEYLSKEAIGLGLKSTDKESLARYMIYNISEGIGRVSNEESVPESTKEKQVLDEFYETNFETSFNDYLLESNNKDFRFTEKGIEFRNNDPISIQEALDKLDQQVLEDLIEYSKGSKSLEDLSKYSDILEKSYENIDEALDVEGVSLPILEINPIVELRQVVYNNPNYIAPFKGTYVEVNSSIGENLKAVRNSTEEFIKVQGEIYENVRTIGDVSIFKKGPTVSDRFYTEDIPTVELITPESELTSLTQDAIKPKVESISSKEEIEEISNKYFEC